ncbi:hypothetical protein A8L34_27885 [Bacillus sp. FJAT-27264]|uniref:hypothetical protein n=1 Tax=Paenibacillus sp. (strain DSM 101736 / FJAT-27264) TaxID=1850362 RepID=UPI000807A806|nr:hypothetical protein [Bacillus sp. FJAT-27264]OBZ15870.1 hypothetical protein A8L34_27885 [Bacillus sp. FJAT-27264]
MEELKWFSDGIGVFAGIYLFLLLVFHPVIATFNGEGYWETVEENIFGSALDFYGSAFLASMVVMSIVIHYI